MKILRLENVAKIVQHKQIREIVIKIINYDTYEECVRSAVLSYV